MSLAVGVTVSSAACRERQSVVAAETALEVKAEVGKPKSVTVTAAYEGRLESLAVAEGAAVRAGDPVATLSNAGVERDVAYARAQLASAERRLQTASRAGHTPAQSDADAQERLRIAQAIVAQKQSRLERIETLFTTRDVTRDDVEDARLELAVARRDLAAERAAITARAAAPVADPELLRLDVEKARAELRVVEDRQRQLAVSAPIGGTVTRIHATPGQLVQTREPILDITDAALLDVRGAIAPELLRHVRTGMAVDVRVFTVPPRTFQTTIRAVVPPADAGGAAIVALVPNPDGVLQPGTPAVITVR